MRIPNWLFTLGVGGLGLTLSVYLQVQELDRKTTEQTPESDRAWIEPEARRLQTLQNLPRSGMGFNNLIADHTYLTFLQYFGDDVARVNHGTGYALSPEYFKIIVQRDPKFIYSYLFLSTSVSIFAGQPQQAVDLMNQGFNFLVPEKQPYAYSAWRRKAVDELLFLGDAQAARNSYLKAADAADRATFPPDALPETKYVANSSRKSADFLATNPNSTSARIGAWSQVLASAPDSKTKLLAVIQLQKLGVPIVVTPQGEIEYIPQNAKK